MLCGITNFWPVLGHPDNTLVNTVPVCTCGDAYLSCADTPTSTFLVDVRAIVEGILLLPISGTNWLGWQQGVWKREYSYYPVVEFIGCLGHGGGWWRGFGEQTSNKDIKMSCLWCGILAWLSANRQCKCPSDKSEPRTNPTMVLFLEDLIKIGMVTPRTLNPICSQSREFVF